MYAIRICMQIFGEIFQERQLRGGLQYLLSGFIFHMDQFTFADSFLKLRINAYRILSG